MPIRPTLLALLLTAGCLEADPPPPELYEIVGTIVSDSCFGETGSTTGADDSYVIAFERGDDGWSVLLDDELGFIPCDGDGGSFTCTTTLAAIDPHTRVYTFEGVRDELTLQAELTLELRCDPAAGACFECMAVEQITGTRLWP
jgi:hypothetical protein